MSAQDDPLGPRVKRDDPTVTKLHFPCAAPSVALARHHVQRELATVMEAERIDDVVLLTSEIVSNAVEYSCAGAFELTVVVGTTFARIEVRNPGDNWGRGPELRPRGEDEVGGRGLVLVEALSDSWGTSSVDTTVWFEFERAAAVGSRGG